MPSDTKIALLRAVNVGGTGRLGMGDLKAICLEAGFSHVRTYIASGNVVFTSPSPEAEIKPILESRLAALMGKPVAVLVRTGAEMASVLAECPFADVPPQQVAVIFLDTPPAADAADKATGVRGEEIRLGRREIYVHYPHGMGTSKLRIPAVDAGTARNLNTVAKLADMAK
jgi:uncharacterized protein (DUF1697 family)